MEVDESQAAPTAVVVRTRNSRRRMGDLLKNRVLRLHQEGRAREGSSNVAGAECRWRGRAVFRGAIEVDFRTLDAKRGGQQAEGEGDGEEDEFQDAVDGDAYDAEREQDQPDEGIRNQREQGQGPAEDEEDAPEQEREHGRDLLTTSEQLYVAGEGNVPSRGDL